VNGDGWAELERLRSLVMRARGNGQESVRLDLLEGWLARAVASGVARQVAEPEHPVILDPVSVRTAASLLSVSPQRVRVLCGSGKLPAVRTPQGWVIPRAAVMERQAQGETNQGSRPAA
jgi:Helix-turn-helix domain